MCVEIISRIIQIPNPGVLYTFQVCPPKEAVADLLLSPCPHFEVLSQSFFNYSAVRSVLKAEEDNALDLDPCEVKEILNRRTREKGLVLQRWLTCE